MNSRNGILFEKTNINLTRRSIIKVILNNNFNLFESIKVNKKLFDIISGKFFMIPCFLKNLLAFLPTFQK